MQLNIPSMQVEQWDAEKLRHFMNYFGITYKEVALAINRHSTAVHRLLFQGHSFDTYNSVLTAYKNAVIVSRIKAEKARCEQMITYYQSF